MDLRQTIQALYAEKEKLARVIASVENLQQAAGGEIFPTPKSGRRRLGKSKCKRPNALNSWQGLKSRQPSEASAFRND
jgi:hypothetical protein